MGRRIGKLICRTCKRSSPPGAYSCSRHGDLQWFCPDCGPDHEAKCGSLPQVPRVWVSTHIAKPEGFE